MGVIEKRRLIALNEPHIVSTTPASVANFNTDMVGKLKQCKVEFAPVQSGTGDPSPTNIRPIIGWTGVTAYLTGKNLIDKTRSANGTYDQTTGEAISSSYQYQTRIEYDIPVAPGEKFIHSNANNNNGRAFFWKQSGEYVGTQLCTAGTAFTIPSNAGKMRFVSSSEGWMLDSRKWQLEKGSTATTYEAYTGISCPVSWTTQGTVYGGYVDLATGELVATYLKKKFSEMYSWSWSSTWNGFVGNFVLSTDPLKPKEKYKAICSAYNYVGAYTVVNDMQCGFIYNVSLIVKDSEVAEDFQAFQLKTADYEISYEINTPIAVATLTPSQIKTIIGTNNIWSDANGNNTIKYWTH